MNIALLRPNYHSHLITPPLGIGYLSSFLKSKNHNVRIIDGLNLELSNEHIADLCSDVHVACISILSSYLIQAADLSRRLKRAGKIVVIGGPHVTALPEDALVKTGADYAICGEGEMALADLIDDINCSRRGDSVRKADLIPDLDVLPFPDWRGMDPRTYKKAPHGGLIKNFPVAPVTTSRGCPYECTFCASPALWGREIRFRSAHNTVDEITMLAKYFNVKEVHFEDDNLTLKKEHISKICELLIERRLGIGWATPNGVRADSLDREMLKLMKRSGCYYVAFGVESANAQILKNIKKRASLESIQRAVTLANQEGIITQGFFIFGLPGETTKTIRETIDFAKKSGLKRAQFLILDVLPGSELWEELKGVMSVDHIKGRSYQDVTWLPQGLKKEDLINAQSSAFKEFFFRPAQLFSLLRFFKISQIPFIVKRVSDYRIIKG